MQEQLKVGSEITIKLPYGDLFSQAHNKINTVFIAGGTGITPYLSLFNDSSFVNYNKPVLYAGFKNAEMNIYKGELLIAKQINSALEINLLYQDIDGILNIEEIHNKSKNDTSFFISGPPIMISSFKEYLLRQGLTKEQIKTDDWE
jgi:predicted ferric reductase